MTKGNMMKYLIWLVLTVAAFAQSTPFAPSGGSQNLFVNVNGGIASIGTSPTVIPATAVFLQASTTNYIYVNLVAGTITSNTTGFTNTMYPVAKAVTNKTQVVTLTDFRPAAFFPSGIGSETPLTTGTSGTLVAPRAYFVCTGTCTVTPPAPAKGYEFCVMNDDNVGTVITLAGITGVQYENTARTAYGTAGLTMTSNGAAANKICLLGLDATHYLAASSVGTWVAN